MLKQAENYWLLKEKVNIYVQGNMDSINVREENIHANANR